MNMSHLRTLIAIVDTQSFTAAADSLFITASAVSHQMRDLEHELGVDLFDRSTRPPKLNAHGYAVVDRGREVLAQFDTLVELARSPGEIGGRLMLGCVSGVSSDLIPLALANLRASHPAVQVSMEEGLSETLANRVRRRELDAAIITELPEVDPELKSLLITEEAMIVVAPRDCRLTQWHEILTAYPFIRLNRNAGMGKVIDRALRENRVKVKEAMELDSSEAVVGMARAGLGAGVIPAGRLRQVSGGEVVALPFGEPPIQRRVVLIERSNNPRSDLSQLVYDEVRRVTLNASSS
ncbi:MAG: LysR family transcriptional regulator [Gammaproteobacteria bacterium]|nr:LysR family transcriptional regulator [Gammaproteobacteria bacterium]